MHGLRRAFSTLYCLVAHVVKRFLFVLEVGHIETVKIAIDTQRARLGQFDDEESVLLNMWQRRVALRAAHVVLPQKMLQEHAPNGAQVSMGHEVSEV